MLFLDVDIYFVDKICLLLLDEFFLSEIKIDMNDILLEDLNFFIIKFCLMEVIFYRKKWEIEGIINLINIFSSYLILRLFFRYEYNVN